MDNNEQSSLDIWNNLSSGVPEEKDEDGNVAVEEQETIFSAIFDFLGDAASWAGDVSDLIGLL